MSHRKAEKKMYKKIAPALCFALIALFAATAARADGFFQTNTVAPIQMLPPLNYNGVPCSYIDGGLLFWDGASAIRCVPQVVGTSDGKIGIGVTTPQYKLDVQGDAQVSGNQIVGTYVQINSTVADGDPCTALGLVSRDENGVLKDCQRNTQGQLTWGSVQTFMNVVTTVAEVDAACVAGGDPSPPNYNEFQYRITCAARLCSQNYGYGFGLLTEVNGTFNYQQPYASPPNTPVGIACSR
jgi:hypothetical protein